MSLDIGTNLGQYRLVSKLGEGGMGVVWRATDTVLGREVAIKVLPDFFASDPERLARFEREAKLLASVNHPNIAAVYGFQSADGVRFLAMELVDGEDLSQRLARGPMDVPEVLSIARPIAEALETAHEKGIIHRDLKPANIKVSSDGRVKVLDFGLAKALEDDNAAVSSQLSQSPTITGRLTAPNVLLGTAAYMSPEQTRGQAADKRADIWAFGVILFEMLAGKQLFEGETVSDTLASVLKTELDWDRLPPTTPAPLAALVRRCLVRDARRRLRDIGEARIVLENIAEGKAESLGPAAPVAPVSSPSRPAAFIGGAVAVGLLLGTVVGAILLPKPVTKPPLRQFILAGADTAGNAPFNPAVSPDGKQVAFMRGGKLWIQELDGLDAHPVDVEASSTSLNNPGYPFWSPDSRDVAYLVGSRIIKVSAASRQSQVVTDASKPFTNGRGAAWCDDGTIIATRAESDGLLSVSALGGDARAVLLPDSTQESDFHEPSPLPGGGVVFAVHRRQGLDTIAIFVHGKRKNVLTIEGQRLAYPLYSSTGHIIFQRQPTNGGIWAVPFSLSKQTTTGEPFLVISGGARPTLARDGTLVYLRGSQSVNTQPVWMDATGREVSALGGAESGYQLIPRVSPDGQRIIVGQNEDQEGNLFVIDPARHTKTRLTFEKGVSAAPAWSPDGRRVIYQWTAGAVATTDGYILLSRSVDGSDTPDTLLRGGVLPSISPDGRYLIYSADPGHVWQFDLMMRPLEPGGVPFAIAKGTGDQFSGVVSPRGDLIAYASDESGTFQVYIKRFPSGEGRWQVSTNSGAWPRWNQKGDRLYYVEQNDLMEVEIGGGAAPVLGTPQRLFTRGQTAGGFRNLVASFDVAPDGRFVLMKPIGLATGTTSVAAIQNWYEGFREKKR